MKKPLLEILLAEETAAKLDEAIEKGRIEDLKKQLVKLFGHAELYNIHDDHLRGLAEAIIDLAQTDDKKKTAEYTIQNSERQMATYQRRCERNSNRYIWAKMDPKVSETELLDLEYQRWVFLEGYEHSRYEMFLKCSSIARRVLEQAGKEEGGNAK